MGDVMPKGKHDSYRIGEAAQALELKTCVLRFWESEFPQLSPVRTPKGQRLYSETDMALLRRIRSLLHEQGMTIEGARRVLAGELAAPANGSERENALSPDFRLPHGRQEGSSQIRQLLLPCGEEPSMRPPSSAAAASSSAAGALDPAASSESQILAEAAAELKSLRTLLAGVSRISSSVTSAGTSTPGVDSGEPEGLPS